MKSLELIIDEKMNSYIHYVTKHLLAQLYVLDNVNTKEEILIWLVKTTKLNFTTDFVDFLYNMKQVKKKRHKKVKRNEV